jgi:pyridoxal phosphate-dependent aminotransferase EpsN
MCGEEIAFVNEAFRDNYIAPAGPHIEAFEREMESYLGGRHCVALVSGTAALHLALGLAGVRQGDTVPCSDLTFIASASPIVHLGGRPYFIDAERKYWNMDPDLLAETLETLKSSGILPSAIVLVHLYGQPAKMDALIEICNAYGVTLIEDAAEALGSTFQGAKLGTFGRFGVLSFNGNKIITTSGGGMLVCRHKEDADKARHLATQAREPAPHYEHAAIGYNYRMSNICAAIGRGQLRAIELRVDQKRKLFSEYRNRLGHLAEIDFQEEPDYGATNRWLTCVTFSDSSEPEAGYNMRESVRLALEKENIESRPLWKPMHSQPVFRDSPIAGGSVGEDLFARGLCLPSGTALTENDLSRICEIIEKTLTH